MLSETCKEEFFERGFTHVPNVLPDSIRSKMVHRIWESLEDIHGMQKGDTTTWIEGGVRGIGFLNKEAVFRPFGTPELIGFIDTLLGVENWRKPPGWGQVLVTFPADTWDWDSLFQRQIAVEKIMWHTDYPYDSPPSELAGVQVFCLLEDIEVGGGGTLIVEGSHQVIHDFVMTQNKQTLAKMKRARLALFNSDPWFHLIQEAPSRVHPKEWMDRQQGIVGNIPVRVRELTGRAGDVYLTHPWLLHAASPNSRNTPRIMCTQRIYREATQTVSLA